jgi:putative membrane protein
MNLKEMLDMMRYGYPGAHYGGWMMFPSIMCMLVFTILIVYLLARFVRNGKRQGNYFNGTNFGLTNSTTKALEILNVRYVNGEISDEEYNNKKEQILKK